MKTWEMIKMLEENPELKFKCSESRPVLRIYGPGLVWETKDGSMTPASMILSDDWQLVRTPVTWQEALQAWVDGKTIKWFCPPNNEGMISRTFYPSCTGPDRDMLKTGTWYIEE
jgi:hypothetical protein